MSALPLLRDTEPTGRDSLRPYQSEAVEALRRSIGAGSRAPILVAPCGAGKTIIARAIVDGAVAKGKRVLFLAPRRELIFQTAAKLDDAGIHHGVYMAGEERDLMAPVQVASTPTVYSRMKSRGPFVPPADLVIVDECHLAIAESTMAVLREYPGAVRIGLTATPCRGDGRGLGEAFDDIVLGPSMVELMEQKYLVEPRYFAPSKPDLEGVKIQMGDYNQKQLGSRMDDPILIGDVVTNWLRIAPDRQTIVFAVNIAHSVHLRDRFAEAGVVAEHLDGNTPHDERAAILRRFENGDTRVITNCQVFAYGVDCPPASCAVLAHPTKSIARYVQAVGRVLRPYPGKADCIVIDHAGIVDELGFVEQDFPWTLDGKERVQERQSERKRKEPKPLVCTECYHTFENTGICPNCGHNMIEAYGKAIKARDADLAEVDRKHKEAAKREWSGSEKQLFYSELLHIALDRGYKPGWAAMKYKERIGVWPRGLSDIPTDPRPETLSWVRSRMIAWAKAKKAGGERAAA